MIFVRHRAAKLLTIAEYMQNSGKITACDMYKHKLKLIEKGAKRLGINIIETCLRDGASADKELPSADQNTLRCAVQRTRSAFKKAGNSL